MCLLSSAVKFNWIVPYVDGGLIGLKWQLVFCRRGFLSVHFHMPDHPYERRDHGY